MNRVAILGLMAVLAGLTALAGPAAGTDLRGHGGPVRAIALSPDGGRALTGSFDSTAIIWSLARGEARQVLRFHQGAVHAVAHLPDQRLVTAGEDGRIALWVQGAAQPERVLTGHSAPVTALAVAPDGRRLLSASWDGTARAWSLADDTVLALEDHRANVNGAGFLADGRIVTAAYDGAVRVFSAEGRLLRLWQSGVPASGLLTGGGEIIVASADGAVRFIDPERGETGRVAVSEAPIVALAASPDGRLVAAAGFRGALALVERAERRIERRMEGPTFPLWSLAFSADGREILTGGADRLVRRWHVASGEPVSPVLDGVGDDIPARLRDHPGAAVFRACAACHTLGPEGGNRAGPTLLGLFGRRVGTAPGYDYSPALRSLSILWDRDTVSRLFAEGPSVVTPGSKMPEQIVSRAEDRDALIDFLEQAQTR